MRHSQSEGPGEPAPSSTRSVRAFILLLDVSHESSSAYGFAAMIAGAAPTRTGRDRLYTTVMRTLW